MPSNEVRLNGSDRHRWDVPDSKMGELVTALNRLGVANPENVPDADIFLTSGEMIMLRRKRLGMTQGELAEQIGKSKKTIQRIEGGQLSDDDIFRELAKVLHVPESILTLQEAVQNRMNHPELGNMAHYEVANATLLQLRGLAGILDSHVVLGCDPDGELIEASGCPGPELCDTPGCHGDDPDSVRQRLLAAVAEMEKAAGAPVKVTIRDGEIFVDLDPEYLEEIQKTVREAETGPGSALAEQLQEILDRASKDLEKRAAEAGCTFWKPPKD